MQLQMNSSFKKVLMLIPLWEQRLSGLTRLPPLAASLPSGWSAAASAQLVPAFPEVAGFSLQSMTNKSNPNSHEQIRLRLFCPSFQSQIWLSDPQGAESTRKHTSAQAQKKKDKRETGSRDARGWEEQEASDRTIKMTHRQTKTKKGGERHLHLHWVHVKKQARVFKASH